jgi:hypothetical protein
MSRRETTGRFYSLMTTDHRGARLTLMQLAAATIFLLFLTDRTPHLALDWSITPPISAPKRALIIIIEISTY